MALSNGPLFSLSASGKLANTLVFSRWKGRPYVRELVTPANPQSAAQVAIRAMMRFLAQYWASMTTGQQASWEDLADAQSISAFNAFTQYNLREWRDFYMPGLQYPLTRAQTPDALTSWTAGAVGRDIILGATAAAVNGDNLLITIHRSLVTGFTPNWNNCIRVIPCASGDTVQYTDGPLDPDTYYYRAQIGTEDGKYLDWATEVNATVV